MTIMGIPLAGAARPSAGPHFTIEHPALRGATKAEVGALRKAIQDVFDRWWADRLGMSFYHLTGRGEPSSED